MRTTRDLAVLQFCSGYPMTNHVRDMSGRPFKLGILIPLWKRRLLSEFVLRYYAQLEVAGVDFRRVAIYSPDDEDWTHLPKISGWEFVSYPNLPVSNKWNFGMRHLNAGVKLDAAMCIGSDDLVTPQYFEEGTRLVGMGKNYVRASAVYFYDARSGEAFYSRATYIGACSFMSHPTLLKCSFRPWQDGLNSGIDSFMSRRLRARGVVETAVIECPTMKVGPAILDIKSHRLSAETDALESTNIHSFSRMRQSMSKTSVDVDGRAMLELLFPAEAARIISLGQALCITD